MDRFFIGFTVFTLVLVIVVAGGLFWEALFSNWPVEVIFAFSLAVMNLNLFNDAIESPFYTTRFHQAALDRGWFEPYSGFLREFNRYREAHGQSGRLAGDIKRAAFAWFAYYGLLGVSVWLPLTLYPLVGISVILVFAAIDFPTALALFFLYGRTMAREFKTAGKLGFRLLELRPRGRRLKA